jgi:hypothetical protein
VGEVAVDAVVAVAAAALKVPMAGHAAVGAVLVVAVLNAVALSTQGHCIGDVELLAVCEVQLGPVVRLVARVAAEGAVHKCDVTVKVLWRVVAVHPGALGIVAVAGGAGNAKANSACVFQVNVCDAQARWLVDLNRMRRAVCGSFRTELAGRVCEARTRATGGES